MKNIMFTRLQRTGFGLLAAACLSLVFGINPAAINNAVLPAAYAEISTPRPDTPIGVINHAGGSFKQDLNNYGRWTEYDHRGAVRFTFSEVPSSEVSSSKVSSDDKMLRLRGDGEDVDLVFDLSAKTVSGQWPGHPMAVIYRVTDIDYLSFAMAQPEPVKPPVIIPPLPQEPPTVSPAVTGQSVNKAVYDGGYFTQTSPVQWQEKTSSGPFINFRKVGHDARSVYLYDSSRKYLVEIDTGSSMIRLSDNGGRLTDLYPVTDFDVEPPVIESPVIESPVIEPPVIEPPAPPPALERGRLTAREQVDCISSGGVIERAGMLGYERCTLRYSDAGRPCSDSSICQGKCLANLDQAQSKNVTGTCQATDNPFGCYAEVIDGETAPALCVD